MILDQEVDANVLIGKTIAIVEYPPATDELRIVFTDGTVLTCKGQEEFVTGVVASYNAS